MQPGRRLGRGSNHDYERALGESLRLLMREKRFDTVGMFIVRCRNAAIGGGRPHHVVVNEAIIVSHHRARLSQVLL